MARPAQDPLPPLEANLSPGGELVVRAKPGASRTEVWAEDGRLCVRVTAVTEGGKANEAIRKALAKALGVPKSRLELLRGNTSREKVFRVLP